MRKTIRDRYKVPGFCKIKKYGSKKRALQRITKGTDWVVHRLSLKKVKEKC